MTQTIGRPAVLEAAAFESATGPAVRDPFGLGVRYVEQSAHIDVAAMTAGLANVEGLLTANLDPAAVDVGRAFLDGVRDALAGQAAVAGGVCPPWCVDCDRTTAALDGFVVHNGRREQVGGVSVAVERLDEAGEVDEPTVNLDGASVSLADARALADALLRAVDAAEGQGTP